MIPRAVAVCLPEPALQISASPRGYQSHFSHAGERIWPETNCYLDLWIETLHDLWIDPVPAFACALSADHDGLQWTFLKQQPEDLRQLYGLEVTEEIVWLPLLETVESGPSRGVLNTVEVDSWWLPDTAGTAYHADHVKKPRSFPAGSTGDFASCGTSDCRDSRRPAGRRIGHCGSRYRAVVLSNAGLSGVRIDVYNDTPDSLAGELVLVATNFLGQRTVEARRAVSIPGRSSLTFFDSSLSGAFRDLSNSFGFGKPTADGIEAVVEFVGSPYMIRDALIVNPRPGQANSGIRALAYPSDETDWTLEISSDVALRYVSIDAPGWIPSDNFFHLLAATPYSVRLPRCCDQAAPLGKVASVDSLGTATITASA